MDENKNLFLEQQSSSKINFTDTAWILVSTILVFIMIPGLGFFYGGLAQRKNQLSLLITGGFSICIVSIQWFLFGYSLVFSDTGSKFIGNFDHVLLKGVGSEPNKLVPNLPSNVFMIYQNMFAVITPYIAFGGPAERATIKSFLIFLVLWSTFVYDFIAYWTWGLNGWLKYIGCLDFAGGTPVHMASGFSALAYALAVGPRKKVDFDTLKPSSVSYVYLGTGLLWFGWFGFNGGSEGAINARAVNAVIVSNLAASAAGISWIILDMLFRRTKKMSLNGFCGGAVCGLVGITPAAGYVTAEYAVLIGLITAFVCYFACQLKFLINHKIDDACDVFAIHGVGGLVGSILTGFFAQNSIAVMSGGAPASGALDKNFYQIVLQLISVAAACPWAFIITYVIVKLIHYMPGINLRLNESEEQIGNDWIEIGEANCSIIGDSKSELNSIHRLSFSNKDKCETIKRETVELKNVLRMSNRFKNTVEPMEINSQQQQQLSVAKIKSNGANDPDEIHSEDRAVAVNNSSNNNIKSSTNGGDEEKF